MSQHPLCAALLGGSSMWSRLASPLSGFSGGMRGVLDHGCDLGREMLRPDLPPTRTSKQPQLQTHLRERRTADASSASSVLK